MGPSFIAFFFKKIICYVLVICIDANNVEMNKIDKISASQTYHSLSRETNKKMISAGGNGRKEVVSPGIRTKFSEPGKSGFETRPSA